MELDLTEELKNKKEEEKRKQQLKEKKAESFKTIVDMNNRKIRSRKEADE